MTARFCFLKLITINFLYFLACLNACIAQSSPNCPLLGAVFSHPTDVLEKSTAVSNALSNLQATLQQSLANNTLDRDNTTFHLSVFSADSTLFNFAYAALGLNGLLTSGKLDENTIFRIGSVSKLLTVYTFLVEAGMKHMDDPVTKWVPELARASKECNRSTVNDVIWEETTIRALASHMAGINRDLSFSDLSLFCNSTIAKALGLPVLLPDQIPTICGTTNLGIPPCSRALFFQGMESLRPITSSFQTPIYSNIAYQILAYALEGVTKRSFSKSFSSTLLQPLNLSRTYLEPPPTIGNAIIPESELLSWWNISTGGATSFGGMYSTPSDLTLLDQSVLKSTLVKSKVTRQWLQPITNIADLQFSVGMPWEIHRMLLPLSPGFPNTRVVDLYTKNGALGSYTSLLVLSPGHNMGFVLLIANAVAQRASGIQTMAVVGDIVTNTLVPAFEAAAREQAWTNFGGTYTNLNTSMTLTITVDDGLPGLGVKNWTMGGLTSLRLYPMDLNDGEKMAWRGVYETVRNATSAAANAVFSSGCAAWGGVDAAQYGNVGFDDFDFVLDGKGVAVAVVPRVPRQTLLRVVT